jgi:hypothetical protein
MRKFESLASDACERDVKRLRPGSRLGRSIFRYELPRKTGDIITCRSSSGQFCNGIGFEHKGLECFYIPPFLALTSGVYSYKMINVLTETFPPYDPAHSRLGCRLAGNLSLYVRGFSTEFLPIAEVSACSLLS